jgi:CBS domain-containing protein
LLVQLVAAQNPHQVVTRLITDIGDATTRRLLALAEAKLGPPPVPYLWLACGSQGRQEQTGVSDQDNCLILDDSAATPPTTPISRRWRNSCPTASTKRDTSTAPAT